MPIFLILNVPAEACFSLNPSKQYTVAELRNRYELLKKDGGSTTNQSATGDPSVGYCKWYYEINFDPKRMPPRLLEAKLNCTPMPSCALKCTKQVYSHTVLKEKCDRRTGENVWKWHQDQLAIAFVYESLSN
jgi:hypothetical protein